MNRVYDSWWPWKIGVIVWRGKTRLRVRFSDGTEWTYDRAHQKYLRPL